MYQSPNKQAIENTRKKSDIVSIISCLSLNDLLPMCIEILQKNPENRRTEDLQIMQAATSEIKFFRQVLEEQGEGVLRECLRKMSIEIYDENDVVIEQGDKAQSFYVILQGIVSVFVYKNPYPEEKDNDQERIERIRKKSFLAKKLYVGECFGELALLNEGLRSASIVSDCHCVFAVLSKKDYRDILQKAQENKLRQRIKEFHSCLKHHDISTKLLNILFFAFQSSHYQFRQAVYLQGQPSKQEIYLIQNGEFVITHSCDNFYSPKKQTTQVALLQKGQIFGDLESFQNIDKRQQNVFCNSNHGVVLKIQLSSLIQRLQQTNELHLYDQLKNLCLQREQVRTERQQKQIPTEENVVIDMRYVKRRDLSYQVKRVRSAKRNTFSIRSPLQMVEEVVKYKKQVYLQLYKEEDYRTPQSRQSSTQRPNISQLRRQTWEQFLTNDQKYFN